MLLTFIENSALDKNDSHNVSLINDIILLLISKKQFHLAFKLFEMKSPNLKELFKPSYYALMHYLKDEYPNEYIKMGNELKQPVEEIIKKIEVMAIDYK